MAAVSINAAAAELRVQPDTVRVWIRRGAPVVQPGANGPGRGALVDIEKLRRWRARTADDAPLVAFDADLIARGAMAAYRNRDIGLTDRQAAALLAEAWAQIVREATGHPPSEPWPGEIATLIAIAASSGSVNQR
jgi:hypothetical protein